MKKKPTKKLILTPLSYSELLKTIPKDEDTAELYNFELRYFEGGMAFNGRFVAEKGQVEADETGKHFGDIGG